MAGGTDVQIQSVIFDEASIQISYYEEADRNEAGMKITTCVVNPLMLKEETADLIDSAEQMVVAWERMYRQKAIPVPPSR
jgi:hypothetical protein